VQARVPKRVRPMSPLSDRTMGPSHELGRALARAMGDDFELEKFTRSIGALGLPASGIEWAYIGALEVVLEKDREIQSRRDADLQARLKDGAAWGTLRSIADAVRRYFTDDDFGSEGLRKVFDEHLKDGVPWGYDPPYPPERARKQAVMIAAKDQVEEWGSTKMQAGSINAALVDAVNALQPEDWA
jgi:hypothetical protein